MYVLPQEVEVWYIIPAIRRELSKNLIREHNITYSKTGKLLGVTKSAISQYLSKKRATKIKLHPKAMNEVIKSGEKIVRNKSNALVEIQSILKTIRKKRYHCEICGGMKDGKFHDCTQIIPKYLDDI